MCTSKSERDNFQKLAAIGMKSENENWSDEGEFDTIFGWIETSDLKKKPIRIFFSSSDQIYQDLKC
jgi:hypothetical protein